MKHKTKFTAIAAITLQALLLSLVSGSGADITATGSGNWSSTVPDAPWPGGVVPGDGDSVDVEPPHVVTVDSTASCSFLYGDGTVVMAPGATLTVMGDTGGAYGAQDLAILDATATGSTVIYKGNPFWAKRTDYFHLEFAGAGDFYNGAIPGVGATPMNIAGNMTLNGTNVAVQQGADVTIGGDLIITGATNKWDASSFNLTVTSNTYISGTRALLLDLDGAAGTNYFTGNMFVSSNALAWNVSDVIHWFVGGSLTNQGLIAGKGYGSITFDGAGVITGKPVKLPTITVSGTYAVDTTITLTTNTPTLTGTLVFDLASTNQLILQSTGTNLLTLYYDGVLDVTNSGAAPTAGSTYKLFSATNYDGAFVAVNLPTLPGGLTWQDNLLSDGSITAIGGVVGSPTLSWARTNNVLTLSWDSTTYTGFHVEGQTNSAGVASAWFDTGSGTVSPFVTNIDPSSPPVFFRLKKP